MPVMGTRARLKTRPKKHEEELMPETEITFADIGVTLTVPAPGDRRLPRQARALGGEIVLRAG
jgi:hypothetical protein